MLSEVHVKFSESVLGELARLLEHLLGRYASAEGGRSRQLLLAPIFLLIHRSLVSPQDVHSLCLMEVAEDEKGVRVLSDLDRFIHDQHFINGRVSFFAPLCFNGPK